MEIEYERVAFTQETRPEKYDYLQEHSGKNNYHYRIEGNKLELGVSGGEPRKKISFNFEDQGPVESPPKIYTHPSWSDFIIAVVNYGDVYKFEKKTLKLLEKTSNAIFGTEIQVGRYLFAPVQTCYDYDECYFKFAHRFNPKTMKIDGIVGLDETASGASFAAWRDYLLMARWRHPDTLDLMCYDVDGQLVAKKESPVTVLAERKYLNVKVKLIAQKNYTKAEEAEIFLEVLGDIGTKYKIQLKRPADKDAGGKKSPSRAAAEGKKSPAKAAAEGKKSPAKSAGKKSPAKAGGKSPAKVTGKKSPAKSVSGKKSPVRAAGKKSPAKSVSGKKSPVRAAGKKSPAKSTRKTLSHAK